MLATAALYRRGRVQQNDRAIVLEQHADNQGKLSLTDHRSWALSSSTSRRAEARQRRQSLKARFLVLLRRARSGFAASRWSPAGSAIICATAADRGTHSISPFGAAARGVRRALQPHSERMPPSPPRLPASAVGAVLRRRPPRDRATEVRSCSWVPRCARRASWA